MKIFNTAVAALVVCVAASAASAASYSYDFTGPTFPIFGTNLGSSSTFSDTTATQSVTATALNTESPPAAALNQNSGGLGVNLGFLDTNQLDNIGDDEAIVFDLGAKMVFDSISLTLAFLDDTFSIYGSNSASVLGCSSGGLACLTSVSTLVATGSGILNPLDVLNVDLTGASPFQYLIATVPGGSGDGYRISGIAVSEVPLPASALLLFGGLGALSLARRKRAA